MRIYNIYDQKVISGGSGQGALNVAEKADGSKAVFETKQALDNYTTLHPDWVADLPDTVAVIIGLQGERVDYAYVRREDQWEDIATNFVGEQGPKGDTAKVDSFDLIFDGVNLKGSLTFDDGSTAETDLVDITPIKTVQTKAPDETGNIVLTAGDVGAYTKEETNTQINNSAISINDRISTDVEQLNEKIDSTNQDVEELTETIANNAPYKIYKELADIPVELEDLDGVNDDQIRINNISKTMIAMGAESKAHLLISNDMRLTPFAYGRLDIDAEDLTRASATLITKSTSIIYLISMSATEPENCSGWTMQVNDKSLKTNAKIDKISAENSLIMQVDNNDVLTISNEGINAHQRKIENLLNATNPQDAVTKIQMEHEIDRSFLTATQATVDNDDYVFSLKDLDKDLGYGKDNDKISYFPPQETVTPDLAYGKWFFIHQSLNTTSGYHMIHKSLLPDDVQDNQFVFFQLAGDAKAALGKSNQSASSYATNGIWNSNAKLIPNTENANIQRPSEYLDKDGNTVTEFDQALSASYSFGAMNMLGSSLLIKGVVKYQGDDQGCYFVEDPSSDWYVFHGTAGGGTFATIKIFQIFPKSYDDLSYLTETAAEALGIKVSANAEAIRELQENQIDEEDQLEAGFAFGQLYAKYFNVG